MKLPWIALMCLGLMFSACSAPAAAPSPTSASPTSAPTAANSAAGQALQDPTQIKPLAQRAQLKLAIPPTNYVYLALMLAIDKGYFDRAGLDVQVTNITGSSTTILPSLAKGDVDIATANPAPGTFNLIAQNFGISMIVNGPLEKPGRMDSSGWMTVVNDEANQIKDLKDLKGKTIEAGLQGSPFDIAAISAVQAAGLDPNTDVTFTYRVKDASDLLTLAKNKAADVVFMFDPFLTQAVQQGFVVKWKQAADVVPWYQPAQLAVNNDALKSKQAAVEKFVEVYVVTCRLINSTNGVWTDDLLKTAEKWGQVDESTVKAVGDVPYYDPNGQISIDSIQRTQQFLVDHGQMKQAIDVNQLVSTDVLSQALDNVGRASQ